jgi:hypothetical protein
VCSGARERVCTIPIAAAAAAAAARFFFPRRRRQFFQGGRWGVRGVKTCNTSFEHTLISTGHVRACVCVCGVWRPQQHAFSDV